MPRLISPRLREIVAGASGKIQAHIDIVDINGTERLLSTRRGPFGEEGKLKIVAGEVSTDMERDIPGEAHFTLLVDSASLNDLIPRMLRHPLSPLAKALVDVWFSAEGDPESLWTRYGRYDLATVKMRHDKDGIVMDCESYDLARRIQRHRYTAAFLIGKGTPYHEALWHHLTYHGTIAHELINLPTINRTAASHWVYDTGDDRLEQVRKIAEVAGMRTDFNEFERGEIGWYPLAEPEDDPSWTFIGGDSDSDTALYNIERELSDAEAYNGVIVVGQSPGSDKPPVRTGVWDTDPKSLTYYNPNNLGANDEGYGANPYIENNPYVVTHRQGLQVARGLLPSKLGATDRVTATGVPNPGIKENDVIRIEDYALAIDGGYVAQAITIPLRSGKMSVTCRERRVVE